MPFILYDINDKLMEEDMPDPTHIDLLDSNQTRERAFLDFDLDELLSALRPPQHTARTSIHRVHLMGLNHHAALLVTYADNLEVVVRVPRPMSSEKNLHSRRKLLQEFDLLRWLSLRTTIPISRPLQDGTEGVTPFTMTSKCEGKCLLFEFGGLSYDLQVANLRSYADIVLQLFALDGPQTIGSLISFNAAERGNPDIIGVGPCILPQDDFGFGRRTFTDIHAYLTWLVDIKKQQLNLAWSSSNDNPKDNRTHANCHPPSESLWNRLDILISREITGLPAATLRIVPAHQDFSSQNVVIDNTTGQITGVFDWEYHALLPAALAADYPSWIECSAESNQTMERENFSSFWLVSRETAPQLRAEYDKMVQDTNPDYYLALTKGKVLREAHEWLIKDDWYLDCKNVEAWLKLALDPLD